MELKDAIDVSGSQEHSPLTILSFNSQEGWSKPDMSCPSRRCRHGRLGITTLHPQGACVSLSASAIGIAVQHGDGDTTANDDED